MEFKIHIFTKKFTKGLIVFVLCLTLAGSLSTYFWLAKFPVPSSKWFYGLFSLDEELNIPAWYSAFSLLLCSALLAVIAKLKEEDYYFRYWKTLSFIFLYLSLDEAFSFHEILIIPSLRKALHLSPIFFQTWVIAGIIFLAVFTVKYLKFLLHLPNTTRYLFFIAAVVYVSGTLGMEMVGGVLEENFGGHNPITAISIVLEEFLEMAGIVIFIYALLTYLSRLQEIVILKIYISEK